MYITVKFNAFDARAYTYAWRGDTDPQVGDVVQVENKGGMKPVTVVMVDVPEPSFPCKFAEVLPPKEECPDTKSHQKSGDTFDEVDF